MRCSLGHTAGLSTSVPMPSLITQEIPDPRRNGDHVVASIGDQRISWLLISYVTAVEHM